MSKFTHKTRDGRKAYLLDEKANAAESGYTVIAVVEAKGNPDRFYTLFLTEDLKVAKGHTCDDLFEYNPAEDLKVDQPIWVRDKVNKHWYNRHFCKYENKTVYCWGDGKTSFTTETYSPWAEFTTTDPEV